MIRFAIISNTQRSPLETVQRYLPSNYTATEHPGGILIEGMDNAGWTLTDYCIPRLASGLHFAREVDAEQVLAWKAVGETLRIAATVAAALELQEDESVLKLLHGIANTQNVLLDQH